MDYVVSGNRFQIIDFRNPGISFRIIKSNKSVRFKKKFKTKRITKGHKRLKLHQKEGSPEIFLGVVVIN